LLLAMTVVAAHVLVEVSARLIEGLRNQDDQMIH